MTFPTYPETKGSGVDWMGDIPQQWVVFRLKDIAESNNEVLPDTTAPDYEIEYVEISGVDAVNGIVQRTVMPFGQAPSRARRRVADGDILVSTVRTYLKAIAPVIDPPDYLVVSTGFAVIRPKTVYSGYLSYLLRSEFVIGEIISRSVGVSYPAINTSEIMNIRVAVPSAHDEQAAISAFLDRETKKIDALVAEQERLIALLKEKRQAVISHAVTKGVKSSVPVRNTKYDWLGFVASHWIPSIVGYICEFISYGFTNPMPSTDEGPYLLTANDIGYGIVHYSTARHTTMEAYRGLTEKCRPIKNDILLTKDGTLGRVAIHDGTETCVNQSVALLRVIKEKVIPEFLLWLLQGGAYQEKMQYDAGGTTIKHIYITRLSKMPVFLPSLDEQCEIVEYLNDRVAKFDNLISNANKAIALLEERRTALISAAVTGKIDVRGLVPETTEAA
jgi:type I restriction enzyme S subunit